MLLQGKQMNTALHKICISHVLGSLQPADSALLAGSEEGRTGGEAAVGAAQAQVKRTSISSVQLEEEAIYSDKQ